MLVIFSNTNFSPSLYKFSILSFAWKLKLIEDWGGYDSTIEASRVDQRAQTWDGKEEYSRHIRAHLPPK